MDLTLQHYGECDDNNIAIVEALLEAGANARDRRSEFGDKAGIVQLSQLCQWVTT